LTGQETTYIPGLDVMALASHHISALV